MATQISPALSSVPATVGHARPRSRAAKVMRYELNVVGSDVAEVVAGLGGWLFDRRMAGWTVRVFLTGPSDGRALHILGVKTGEWDGLWRSASGDPESVAMTVIAAGLFETDEMVRTRGVEALRNGSAEVAFWGARCPAQAGATFRRTQYRLSAAARAFKSHALTAAGVPPESASQPETVFRCVSVGEVLDTDLVPVY